MRFNGLGLLEFLETSQDSLGWMMECCQGARRAGFHNGVREFSLHSFEFVTYNHGEVY